MDMSFNLFIKGVACIGLLTFFTDAAHAERPGDKAWLQGAIFLPKLDTDARFDLSGQIDTGTEIDFESDLGLKDRDPVLQLSGGVRLSKRFRAEAEYFALKRQAEVKLGKEIIWEDTVYNVGAEVRAGYDSDLIRAAVGYSFVRKPDLEVGARIGAHVVKYTLFIEGEANVNGGGAGVRRKEENLTVPLPNAGLYLNYDISRTFAVHAGADYFQIKLGKYKGRLTNLSAGVSARIHRNVGVGVQYRHTAYFYRVRSDDLEGSLNYSLSGPVALVEIIF